MATAKKQSDSGNSNSGNSTALAPANDNSLAPRPADALADMGFDGVDSEALANDGLGEAGREDMKIAIYTLNNKGTGKDGRALPKDAYFDTVTETVKDEVNAVFCLLHKTNVYSVYNNDSDQTEIICKSFDRLKGTMSNGTIRPCLDCPDAQWRTEPDDKGKPKRVRNCAEVHNVFAIDRDTQMPFIVRYKKTSLPVWRTHLQKHHLGRRVLPGGKRANYPLYAFGVTMRAKMAHEKANYAIPIIEYKGVLSRDEILAHAQNTADLALTMRPALERAEAIDEQRSAGGGGDTSFDTDKYRDATGDDFVPAAAAAADAKGG